MADILDKLGDWNIIVLIVLFAAMIVVLIFAAKGLVWLIAKVWDALERMLSRIKQWAKRVEIWQKISNGTLLLVGIVIICVTFVFTMRSCFGSYDYNDDEDYIQYQHRPDRY